MAQGQEHMLRMLSKALEMEVKGHDFYAETLAKCTNALGREVFSMLKADELVHMERIKSIYSSIQSGAPWPKDWKRMAMKNEDLSKVFKDLAAKYNPSETADAGDLKAIDIGIEFENASVQYYQEHLARTVDPLAKEFIERMIGEERGHHSALGSYKLFLEDPVSWFRETERGGLDGA